MNINKIKSEMEHKYPSANFDIVDNATLKITSKMPIEEFNEKDYNAFNKEEGFDYISEKESSKKDPEQSPDSYFVEPSYLPVDYLKGVRTRFFLNDREL